MTSSSTVNNDFDSLKELTTMLHECRLKWAKNDTSLTASILKMSKDAIQDQKDDFDTLLKTCNAINAANYAATNIVYYIQAFVTVVHQVLTDKHFKNDYKTNIKPILQLFETRFGTNELGHNQFTKELKDVKDAFKFAKGTFLKAQTVLISLQEACKKEIGEEMKEEKERERKARELAYGIAAGVALFLFPLAPVTIAICVGVTEGKTIKDIEKFYNSVIGALDESLNTLESFTADLEKHEKQLVTNESLFSEIGKQLSVDEMTNELVLSGLRFEVPILVENLATTMSICSAYIEANNKAEIDYLDII